jgi:hypothetical protein
LVDRQRIGEILVRRGACDKKALSEAWEQKVLFGDRFGTNLLSTGAISEEDLARALGEQHGVHAAYGELIQVNTEAVPLVPKQVAQMHNLCPHHIQGKQIFVLMTDPWDITGLDSVRFASGHDPVPVVVCEARMWRLLGDHYDVHKGFRAISLAGDAYEAAKRKLAQEEAKKAHALQGPELTSEDDFHDLYAGIYRTENKEIPGLEPQVDAPSPQVAQPHPATPPAPQAGGEILEDLEPLTDLEPLESLEPIESPPPTPPQAPAHTAAPAKKEAPPALDAAMPFPDVATGGVGPAQVSIPEPSPEAQKAPIAPAATPAAIPEAQPAPEPKSAPAPMHFVAPANPSPGPPPSATQEGRPPPEPIQTTEELVLELDQETPLSFDEAVERLQGVSDRNEIAKVVLRYAHSVFERTALFTVNSGFVAGWMGLGEGLGVEALRPFALPVEEPSVFSFVVKNKAHFIGPLQSHKANGAWVKATGRQLPKSVAVFPVMVRRRVVNLLYGDKGHGKNVDADVGNLLILAQRIADSYEALLRKGA